MRKETIIENKKGHFKKGGGKEINIHNSIMTPQEILKSYEKNGGVVEINGRWIDVDWNNTEFNKWGNYSKWGNAV